MKNMVEYLLLNIHLLCNFWIRVKVINRKCLHPNHAFWGIQMKNKLQRWCLVYILQHLISIQFTYSKMHGDVDVVCLLPPKRFDFYLNICEVNE